MASYTFLWAGPTWEDWKKGGPGLVDYVAGDSRRPLSQVRDGDEIFVVNVKGGRLRLGGRLVVDGGPVTEAIAATKLPSERLINKQLYVFGKRPMLDAFRPDTYLDQAQALRLELIDVNGTSKTPDHEPGNPRAIYRQEFRQPMRLTEEGAAILRASLGLPAVTDVADADVKSSVSVPPGSVDESTGLSLEGLLARMAANAETGRIGEDIALATERRRIGALGCPDPVTSVQHIAPERVDAGYDIESRWNGDRRCIEVKSSITDSRDFFISENERRTLEALGSEAWLYQVLVRKDGSGEVVEMLPDPIRKIAKDCFKPVAWRVRRTFD